MIRIQNADGIFSSQVPTGRLLWVDQVNGVDKLAVRGRLTIPFKTLTAAADAADPGDTIMVLPGEYHEDELYRDGVNWHFWPGTKVVCDNSGHDLFYVNGEEPFKVTGEGEFDAGAGHCVLVVQHADVHMVFQAHSVAGDNSSPIAVLLGNLSLEVRTASCAYYGPIYIQGGTMQLRAQTVFSSGSRGLHVAGGSVVADIQEIICPGGECVVVADGSCILRCSNIRAGSNAVLFQGGALHIEGAKIYSETEIQAIHLAADGLVLRNCWIFAEGSACIGTGNGGLTCRVVASAANIAIEAGTTDVVGGLVAPADVTD